MFVKNIIQFIFFSCITFIISILFLQMSLKRKLDMYFEKISFNIKFILFEIVNQSYWPLIYFYSIFRY